MKYFVRVKPLLLFLSIIVIFNLANCVADEEIDELRSGNTGVNAGLSLDFNSLNLNIGKSAVLQITGRDSAAQDRPITWQSSFPSKVSVNQSGTITAGDSYYLNPVTISVSTDNGYYATCMVVVTDQGVNPSANAPMDIYSDIYESKYPGYTYVWGDEFNYTGSPNADKWDYEYGYVRNNEIQFYQKDNAIVQNNRLNILGWDVPSNWPRYTSACIISKGKKEFKYGILEVRAKIPIDQGCWPAIWLLGSTPGVSWPRCGEVDIMEYFRRPANGGTPTMLGNWAWRAQSSNTWTARWNSSYTSLDSLAQQHGEPDMEEWVKKFHVWRYVWTEDEASIYLDNVELNRQDVTAATNPPGDVPFRPFQEPHYLLINLAMGGNNGGSMAPNIKWPLVFEVDYVRLYQKP